MVEYTEEDSRGAIKSILILVLIILVVLTIFFLFKYNLPISENPIQANTTTRGLPELENSNFGSVLQFYSNMKFNHNNLSYAIDNSCPLQKRKNILSAFDLLSSEIMVINFYKSDNPDIDVICSNDPKYNVLEKSEFFIAGEGGAKEIVPTGRFNVINKGVILLYEDSDNSIECELPNTELHELMHVFGFNHSQDPNSLMYPYLKSCDQKLDDSIINKIKELYSEQNLPDLYFENVSAVKNGRYLDFNISIKNSGDVNAENVSFSILDDGKLVDTKELRDINFGSGIAMEVRNLKLFKADLKEIRIIIDYFNKIKEIDKENNIATVKFG